MSVETITRKIEPMMGEEFQLVLSYPSVIDGKGRCPITCFISKNGSLEPLGAYIYSIQNRKTQEVVQSVINNGEELLLDLTKRLSMLITKKYHLPSYVSCSGNIQIEQSIIYIKEVINVIDSVIPISN